MKYAQRINFNVMKTEEDFKKLTSHLLQYKEQIDELTIITESVHYGYIPFEEIEKNCQLLGKRIADCKALGFKKVGINCLVSLGHLEEAVSLYGKVPFTSITDPFGNTSKACCCPNDPAFREYIAKKYQMLAKLNPDFLWIDDDIKIYMNGVFFGCFCDCCMEKFNKKHGFSYTRESLVSALQEPENQSLRSLWVDGISHSIEDICAFIGNTVREVNPTMPMGFMSQAQTWSAYNGCDFDKWFTAFNGSKARPGGSFYSDETPENLYAKALDAARQMEKYPDCVTDVQYEIENFPYQQLQKSARITNAECLMAAAFGINGVLLNNIRIESPFCVKDVEKISKLVYTSKSLADKMSAFAGKEYQTVGFFPAYSTKHDRRKKIDEHHPFFALNNAIMDSRIENTYVFGKIGMPLTANENGKGVILHGSLTDGYTDEELKDFLSKGVFIDVGAAQRLIDRGFGDLIGVTIGNSYCDAVVEKCTSDPFNEGFYGETRDVRLSFWNATVYELKPINSQVKVLCEMEDYNGKNCGASLTLYENRLGGKVCVMGYSPYDKIYSVYKREQLLRIADYLIDGLPVRLPDCYKAAVAVRQGEKDMLVTIVNLGTEIMEEAIAEVKGAKKVTRLCVCEDEPLSVTEKKGYGVFELPTLLPYDVAAFKIEY